MFWGLTLKSNKRYSQVVKKAFHISQVALDTTTAKDNEDVQLFLTIENNQFLLCTLKKNVINQTALNLDFDQGEKMSFTIKGTGVVHLTGYLIPEDVLMNDSDDEDMMGLDDLKPGKFKSENNPKQDKVDSDDDDKEDEDNDEDDDEEIDDEEVDEEEDDVDEDDSDDEEDDEDIEMEIPAKKSKLDKVKQNGVEHGKLASNDKKEIQKLKSEEKSKQVQNSKPNLPKRTLQGGVIVEDVKVGTGAEAKSGKKVLVYYEGRLKDTNKVFDSTKIGPGFKFILGRGEVISGWDVGVAGMKVGGKRRVTCPPKMAYGPKGQPPVIPPNSTLVFDVELRNVL